MPEVNRDDDDTPKRDPLVLYLGETPISWVVIVSFLLQTGAVLWGAFGLYSAVGDHDKRLEVAERIDQERNKELLGVHSDISDIRNLITQQADRDKQFQDRDAQLAERIAEVLKSLNEIGTAVFELEKRLIRIEERDRRLEEEHSRLRGNLFPRGQQHPSTGQDDTSQ